MDAVLIGVSDRSLLWRAGQIKETEYSEFVSEYAKFFAENFENVIVTPDDGVYTDIAIKFGKIKDKKPVAYYPDKDTYYGIKHIEKNFQEYNLRPIDGDWYKLNADLTKQALTVVCLGISPGVLIEAAYIKYHQSYGAYKNPKLKNIHLFFDKRTVKTDLPQGFTEQIKNFYYYSNIQELGELIKSKKQLLE